MTRLKYYLEREFSLDDIILAVNLSAQQGINFEILIRERERGIDWSMILREKNIKEDSLFQLTNLKLSINIDL